MGFPANLPNCAKKTNLKVSIPDRVLWVFRPGDPDSDIDLISFNP